jgi:APA family basic amino acid/polyamine antiporter
MNNTNRKLVSRNTAIAIVIANMIGAGVFTSLGYQAATIQSTFPLLMLWLVGGIVALCGALSYGELAGMMPRSGGEYNYLSKIYHPAFGFLSGWISATVGFAAPVALAAMALGRYAGSVIMPENPSQVALFIGIGVVLLVTAIHSYDVQYGSMFQKVSTAVKVILIIGFLIGGFFLTPQPQTVNLLPQAGDWDLVFSPAFAVSLAFVSFAYSGWNASAYLANEIKNPRLNVPISLFLGTMIVMVAYLLLNYVFLFTLSPEAYGSAQAQDFGTPLEVGYLSANVFLGGLGGKIMAGMIALLLISSISAMIFAGPRVTQVMGEDLSILNFFAHTNSKEIPVRAILLQSTISIILITTASFDAILYAIAFTLDIFTFSTVLGVIVMRIRKPNEPRPYRTFAYPLTPLIFLGATGWTMYFLFTQRTAESLVALGVISLGIVIYFLGKPTIKESTVSEGEF